MNVHDKNFWSHSTLLFSLDIEYGNIFTSWLYVWLSTWLFQGWRVRWHQQIFLTHNSQFWDSWLHSLLINSKALLFLTLHWYIPSHISASFWLDPVMYSGITGGNTLVAGHLKGINKFQRHRGLSLTAQSWTAPCSVDSCL